MKAAILTTILLALTTVSLAQTFEWVKSFGEASYEDYAESISVDSSGSVYIAGYFSGTVDFDPGAGTTYLTSSGNRDVFVQKMNAAGNLVWVKSFGGSFVDMAFSICAESPGSVYIAGTFSESVDFDPGTGTTILTSAGSYDIFVQKMDSSGNFIWAKSFGGTSLDNLRSMDVDLSGNVYTTGSFNETVDFDPDAGTSYFTSAGNEDIFVHKMDPSGNFIWAKSFGGSSVDQSYSISTDSSGNVYTTGSFRESGDFNPGAGTNILSSVQNDDVFVQKMDASGDFLWAKSFGGPSYDAANSIATDAAGNVYSTGHFSGTIDFDPGAETSTLSSDGSIDVFIHKMDAWGNFLWAKTFGGPSTDAAHSIDTDASGNIYTTGFFYETADFDPGTGTALLTSVGNEDVFVQKSDPSGNFLWATSFGGSSYDQATSISIDTSGNIYTTGNYNETSDFDPGAGTSYLTSNGQADIFVHKMNPFFVGIDKSDLKVETTISPNPTTGTVNVLFEQVQNNVEFILTDIQGRVIFKIYYDVLLSTNIELNSEIGTYFLNIRTPQNQSTIKLLKK
ncbi:MAG: hypothetical protein K0R65_617 [Crocinitomicaceae bacterium]|jgi:cold shock CspA family protein|nr:hypothetical protein [Crocinitomicaceae bacterium]